MSRSEKYHFIYSGFYSGSHVFETVLKREYNAPRWSAYVDPDSFLNSKLKRGVYNYIIKGHFEDDSPYPKNIFFYVTEDLTVVAGTRNRLWIESEKGFPLPMYACDFLRALVSMIEDWESNKDSERIYVGYRIAT